MVLTRRHAKPLATATLASAVAAAVACGGGASDTSGGGVDAGLFDGRADVGSGETAADSALIEDAGDFATGFHLVTRPSIFQGLTSDGFVVFSEAADGGGQVAEVIALDGGGAATIATGTAADKALRIDIDGRVVFVWTNRGDRVATLTLWSSATGAVAEGSDIRPGRSAATPDGTYVAYVNDVDAGTANIVVSPTASVSPVTVGTLNASDGTCWQNVDLEFAGTPPRFLSFFCPGTSTAFTLRSTATDGTGAVDLSTAVSLETVGTNIVVLTDSDGGLVSSAPDGTNPVTLASNVAAFELSNDESTVAFQTSDDSIETTPIATATPRVAVPAGQGEQLGPISPDESYVLFASSIQDDAGSQVAPNTNVQLASADDGGVRALVSTLTSCPACLVDNFTPDTTFAMVIDPIDNSQTAGGVGSLHVFPLDGGADSRFGTNVYTVVAVDAGSGAGSQLLVVEATPSAALTSGYAYELYTRSLDPSDSPAKIARNAELVGIDDARTIVVYSIPGTGDLAGVWVAPLP